MRTRLLFSLPKAPKVFTNCSIVTGDKTVMSSNHQALLGLTSSGVFLELGEARIRPPGFPVSGEEDEEDEEPKRTLISEFWAILARRALMSFGISPQESA